METYFQRFGGRSKDDGEFAELGTVDWCTKKRKHYPPHIDLLGYLRRLSDVCLRSLKEQKTLRLPSTDKLHTTVIIIVVLHIIKISWRESIVAEMQLNPTSKIA